MPVPRQDIGIGGPQGALEQAIAHGATIDEEVLMAGAAATIGGQGAIASQANPIAALVQTKRIVGEIAPENGGDPGQSSLRPWRLCGEAKRPPAVEVELKRDGFRAQSLTPHRLGYSHVLGSRRLHEFQPRGGGVEKISHLHARAVGAGKCCWRGAIDNPAVHPDRRRAPLITGPRGNGKTRHRPDRGQGFAAKSQGGDAKQVILAVCVGCELGGGVAFHREGQFAGPEAGAVVRHQNARQTSAVGLDFDPTRARVQGVLDQFLDHARRALDHFAGGDAVNQIRRQSADGHDRKTIATIPRLGRSNRHAQAHY